MKLQDLKKQANNVYGEDDTDEYKKFEDKFKLKRTTDDCFTPDNVYETVADYVATRFNVDRNRFVRPFYPGGDYQRYTYKPDSIVVDNPPFSIMAEIVKWYAQKNIKFFLFAPGLTILQLCRYANAICVGYPIKYANGAGVNTSFVHNLPGSKIESSSELYKRLDIANYENSTAKHLPKYEYPDNVLTATMINALSRNGVDYAIQNGQGEFIRSLDSQRRIKKAIFGGGFLISNTAAEELRTAKEQVIVKQAQKEQAMWEKERKIIFLLSERERELIKTYEGNPN